MSDLRVPQRTEIEKRLADALADLLSLIDAGDNIALYQASLRGHQALAQYNRRAFGEVIRGGK